MKNRQKSQPQCSYDWLAVSAREPGTFGSGDPAGPGVLQCAAVTGVRERTGSDLEPVVEYTRAVDASERGARPASSLEHARCGGGARSATLVPGSLHRLSVWHSVLRHGPNGTRYTRITSV